MYRQTVIYLIPPFLRSTKSFQFPSIGVILSPLASPVFFHTILIQRRTTKLLRKFTYSRKIQRSHYNSSLTCQNSLLQNQLIKRLSISIFISSLSLSLLSPPFLATYLSLFLKINL